MLTSLSPWESKFQKFGKIVSIIINNPLFDIRQNIAKLSTS